VRTVLKRHISGPRTPSDILYFTPLFAILRAARHPQEDRRMQTAEMAASLMDNAEFFEELGKLETLPEDDISEFPELSPSRIRRPRSSWPPNLPRCTRR
jgi:hypothetical protein